MRKSVAITAQAVVMGAIVLTGAALGFSVLRPTLRLDTQRGWRAFASGLRRSSDDAIAGTGRVQLSLPGLADRDVVRLTVSARDGLDPLRVRLARGAGTPHRASLGPMPTVLEAAAGSGGDVSLTAEDRVDSSRALYRVHDIAVIRRGLRGATRPWLPLATGLVLYAATRRRRPTLPALAWSLAGMTIVTAAAVSLDPLIAHSTVRTAVPIAWTAGALALVAACGLDTRGRAAARWLATGGPTVPKAVLVTGAVLFVAVVLHAPGLNGPSYWQWHWQRREALVVFPAVIVAALPLFAAREIHRRAAARAAFALALVAAGVMASATSALAVQPGGLARLHAAIEDTGVTGYFTDAGALAAESRWMPEPERLWSLHVHSRTKPPGPLVFHGAILRLTGGGSVGAAVAALLIALAAAGAVPAVYALARGLGETPEAAFEAACVLALSPSLILFLPELDQAFPLVTCLVLLAWIRALGGSLPAAVAFGVAAFLASLLSYSFLVLGVAGLFLAALHPRAAARAAAIAGTVLLVLYAGLHTLTGFDPVATFRAALASQARLSVTWGRAYLPAVWHDPWDFAMGAGWIASLLAVATFVRTWRDRPRHTPSQMGALQIAGVNFSGLLRVEAARVWLLLTPFVAVPAGRELARWTAAERTAAYVVMVLLLAALAQNMVFIELEPQ